MVLSSLLPRDLKQSIGILARVNALRSKLRTHLNSNREYHYVVHCHDRYALAAAALIKAEGYSLSTLLTSHAPFVEDYTIAGESKLTLPVLQGIELFSLNAADYIIAVDEIQSDILKQNVNGELVSVISNAVDMEKLMKIRKSDPSAVIPFIIIARRMTLKNGIDFAIRAFAKSDASKKYQLWIVGDGPEEKKLKELACELGLGSKIKFLGYQSHKKTMQLIKDATISMVPSIPIGRYVEATSLTMLESMALGAPLIASNVGGLKQVLNGHDAALLVEPGDVGSLAKSIDELIYDEALRDKLSKRAMVLVKQYDVNAWYKSISKIYDFFGGCNKGSI